MGSQFLTHGKKNRITQNEEPEEIEVEEVQQNIQYGEEYPEGMEGSSWEEAEESYDGEEPEMDFTYDYYMNLELINKCRDFAVTTCGPHVDDAGKFLHCMRSNAVIFLFFFFPSSFFLGTRRISKTHAPRILGA